MHSLIAQIMQAGNIFWQMSEMKQFERDEGLRIVFPLSGWRSRRDALRRVSEALVKNDIKWLWRKGDKWALNGEGLRAFKADYLRDLTWLKGVFLVEPEVDTAQRAVMLDEARTGYNTSVQFTLYRDEAILQGQQRIFLSHKGADKPLARRLADVLRELGFSPWLDEEAMPAGMELNRGILQGFQDSCAAVFLITPSFTDEKYLRNEINYAVEQKASKGDRFAIITLLFADENDKRGVVPNLLRSYVWKQPDSELEALWELLRALPLELGPPRWRDGPQQ